MIRIVNKREVQIFFKDLSKGLELSNKAILTKFIRNEAKVLRQRIEGISFSGSSGLLGAVRTNVNRKEGKGSIHIDPMFKNQATALELGPQAAGYPSGGKTVYLGSAGTDPKLRAWAEAKLGKRTGKLTIGGPRTRLGSPSHKIFTRAKVGRKERLQALIRKERIIKRRR